MPDRSSPGNPDAAGPAPDGLENDSWNPSIQAAGSLDEAAEAARQAAHAAGREASPLFTGSPGEEGPAPNIPSTLNMNRRASAARTGRAEMEERRRLHTEASPEVSGGDVDADLVALLGRPVKRREAEPVGKVRIGPGFEEEGRQIAPLHAAGR